MKSNSREPITIRRRIHRYEPIAIIPQALYPIRNARAFRGTTRTRVARCPVIELDVVVVVLRLDTGRTVQKGVLVNSCESN